MVTLTETDGLLKDLIRSALSLVIFYFLFLTAIWLSHSQLWAIFEGTASLTRC